MDRTLERNIVEYSLSEDTIARLEDTFDRCTKDETLVFKDSTLNRVLCTRNGVQTANIIPQIDLNSINEIYKHAHAYISNLYQNRLYYYFIALDYAHMIHYREHGHQLIHTHSQIEDHSYIIYLNDSDACTRIYCRDSFLDVESRRGKIVLFDAGLYHKSTECSAERKILVGSVRFVHKVWAPRTNTPLDASLAQG